MKGSQFGQRWRESLALCILCGEEACVQKKEGLSIGAMSMPCTFDNELLYEEREDGTTEIWYSRV
jgi:hypothetical protein